MYYDRQGEQVDLMTWAALQADHDYAVVAQHWVRGWMASTVWIGLDHSFGMGGAPVIFETMIFPPPDEAIEADQVEVSERHMERYPTEAAALAGHDRALSMLREKLGASATADIAGPLVPGSSDSEWDGGIEGER